MFNNLFVYCTAVSADSTTSNVSPVAPQRTPGDGWCFDNHARVSGSKAAQEELMSQIEPAVKVYNDRKAALKKAIAGVGDDNSPLSLRRELVSALCPSTAADESVTPDSIMDMTSQIHSLQKKKRQLLGEKPCSKRLLEVSHSSPTFGYKDNIAASSDDCLNDSLPLLPSSSTSICAQFSQPTDEPQSLLNETQG